jgi:predicted DNA-binding transcriptional regulator AlpA
MTSHPPEGIRPELMTTRQTAELCSVGERTLWAWSRSGISPPPVKIGLGLRPAVRFKRSEYVAWIEGGCKPMDGKGDAK